MQVLTRVLRGSSIFWVKINNLDLLLFEFSTFFNYKKKKKNLGCNEIKKKKLKKKENRRNKYIMMKKEKKINTWGEFCRLEEF